MTQLELAATEPPLVGHVVALDGLVSRANGPLNSTCESVSAEVWLFFKVMVFAVLFTPVAETPKPNKAVLNETGGIPIPPRETT
jgi:hypothetical protein